MRYDLRNKDGQAGIVTDATSETIDQAFKHYIINNQQYGDDTVMAQ